MLTKLYNYFTFFSSSAMNQLKPIDIDMEMKSLFLDAISFNDPTAWEKIIKTAQENTYNFNKYVDLSSDDEKNKEKYSFLGHAIINARNGTVDWEYVNRFIDTGHIDTENIFLYQGVFKKTVVQLLEFKAHFNPDEFTPGSLDLYKKLGGRDKAILQIITPLPPDFKTALEQYQETHREMEHPLRDLMFKHRQGMSAGQLRIFEKNVEQFCLIDSHERYIRERVQIPLINIKEFAFHPHQIGNLDIFFQNYSGLQLFKLFNKSDEDGQRKIIEVLSTSQSGGCLNATLERLSSDIIEKLQSSHSKGSNPGF